MSRVFFFRFSEFSKLYQYFSLVLLTLLVFLPITRSVAADRTPVALVEVNGTQTGEIFYIDKDPAGTDYQLYVGSIGQLKQVENTKFRRSTFRELIIEGYSAGRLIIPGKLVNRFKKPRIEGTYGVRELSVLPVDLTTLHSFAIDPAHPTMQTPPAKVPAEAPDRQIEIKETAKLKAVFRAPNGDLMYYSSVGLGRGFKPFSFYYQPAGTHQVWEQNVVSMTAGGSSFNGLVRAPTEQNDQNAAKLEGVVGDQKTTGFLQMSTEGATPVKFTQLSEGHRRAAELRLQTGIDVAIAPAAPRTIDHVLSIPQTGEFIVIDVARSTGQLNAFIGTPGKLRQVSIDRDKRVGRPDDFILDGGLMEIRIEPSIPDALFHDKDMRDYAMKLPTSKIWRYSETRSARKGDFSRPRSIDDIIVERDERAKEIGYDVSRAKEPAQVNPFQPPKAASSAAINIDIIGSGGGAAFCRDTLGGK